MDLQQPQARSLYRCQIRKEEAVAAPPARAGQLLGIQAGLCFFDRSLSSAITKSGALLT
jgi:hypothetical protein